MAETTHPSGDHTIPSTAHDAGSLRAALRLLLDDAPADRVAASAARGGDDRALGRLLPRLRWEAARAWLRRRPAESGPDRPLAPRRDLPARAALALALHLGLDLPVDRLAGIFQIPADEVGLDLLRARRAVEPTIPRPCPEVAAAVGRARDAALPLIERATLLAHTGGCTTCRAALEASERVDDALLAAIEQARVALPPLAPARRTLGPAGMVATGILLIVLFGAALVAGAGRLGLAGGPEGTPVPLVASPARPALQGWLLLRTLRGVEALDLETMQRVPVSVGDPNVLSSWIVSPSGRYVAHWTPTTNALEVSDIGRRQVRIWNWPRSQQRSSPVGWLGETAILGVEYSSGGPGGDQNNRLIVLDITTGDQRVVYQGPVTAASASPDGTLVLLVLPHQPYWPGRTVELRPVGPDGLGEPIARIDYRFTGAAIWAPDSSRVYLSLLSDDAVTPPGAEWTQREPRFVQRIDVAALHRDGTVRYLTRVGGNSQAEPVNVSPDGQRVLYRLFDVVAGGPRTPVSLWVTGPEGGMAQQVAEVDLSGSAAVWSPDGRTLLLAGERRFYLPGDPSAPDAEPYHVPTLAALEPDGTEWVVAASLTGFGGLPVRWLPPGAIPSQPAPTPTPDAVVPLSPEPVPGLPSTLRTGPVSRPGPDSYTLILQGGDRSVVRSRSGQPEWWLDGATDLNWFGSEPALLGVASATPGSPDGPSRLALYPAPPLLAQTPGFEAVEYQRFDPAGIGDDQTRRYARPLAAPDGRAVAFFVVDKVDGTIALWLAGWDLPPREVARWPGVTEAETRVPPVAAWIDAGTLVYAAPEAWREGLPQRVTLYRVTLRDAEPTPLLTLRAHGADRGVAVTDLAAAPDGAWLAYRVRHFGTGGAAADSLHLAPAHDVTQALEAARGEAAEGMAWSPDGRWLAAALDDRVLLLTADGRTTVPLTGPATAASYPLWVADDEVWFTLDEGRGPRIMRVRLR